MRSTRLPFGAVATAIAFLTAAVVFFALAGVATAQSTGQPGEAAASEAGARASVNAQARSSASNARERGLDLAFNVHASTLGLGGEISKLIGGHLGVRIGGNTLTYNRQQTIQGVAYNARLDFRNYTALADLFPFDHGSFHFTGGYVGSTNAVKGTAVPSADGTIDLNGSQYTSAQLGTMTGALSFPKSAGYAGIGWGSPSSRGGRIRMLLDLGAVIGTPTFDLNASNASSNPQLAADVQAQRDKTRETINKYAKAWPVVSLGLSLHF